MRDYLHVPVKNTFLHIDVEAPLDLRRLTTCPAHVVPTTPPKSTQRWADVDDSDDESVTTCPASVTDSEPARKRWAEFEDSDDESDFVETPAVEPVKPAAAPKDEWTTVSRKRTSRAEATPAKPQAQAPASVQKPQAKASEWTTVARKQRPQPAPRTERAPQAARKAPVRPEPVRQEKRQPKVHRTVPAGVEDGEFKAVRVILGKGGENLKWISEQTGAILSLRGRGAQPGAYEPLHMLIRCAPEKMDSVVRKVNDLFGKVQEDYAAFSRR